MSTTLNGAINASVTSLTVASAAGFPAAGTYNILIDSEVMKVTGGQGTTTWTVVRARRGTTGATHADGATVTLYQRTTFRRLMRGQHSPDILAEAIRELQDALDGTYGHVHTGAQDDGPAVEGTTAYGTGTTSLTPDNAVAHGTTNSPARTDHVHGLAAAVVGAAAFADAAAEGTASSVARSDHVHGMPVNPTNELIVNGDCEAATPTLGGVNGVNYTTAALDAGQAFLGAKSLKVTTAGTSSDAFFSLGDGDADLNGLTPGEYYTLSAYVYVPSGQGITLSTVFLRAYDYQGSYATYTSNTPVAEDRWEKLSITLKLRASATQLFFRLYLADVNAGRYVYYDQIRLFAGALPAVFVDGVTTVTPSTQAIGDSADVGTGIYPARYDHKHAMPSFGPVDIPVFGDAAGSGAATTVARSDHAHGWATTNPYCALYSSADVSIPNGAITPVAFNGVRQDATYMHRTSAANLTGTVAKTAGSATLTGTGTQFTFELNVGQMISVPGTADEVRVITAIAGDTSLTVSAVFANDASGQTAKRVNTGIVARAAGFYLLDACAEWANGTNGARLIGFRVNGTTEILRASTEQTAASTTPSQAISRGYYLNQWDYVELVAYQATDGGGLNITAAGNYSPEFTAQWVAG